MIEAFAESAPQFIMQLSLEVKKSGQYFKSYAFIEFSKYAYSQWNLLSSILSVVFTLSNVYLKMPYADNEIPSFDWKSYVLVLPIMLLVAFPRLLAMSSLLACFASKVSIFF